MQNIVKSNSIGLKSDERKKEIKKKYKCYWLIIIIFSNLYFVTILFFFYLYNINYLKTNIFFLKGIFLCYSFYTIIKLKKKIKEIIKLKN